MKSHFSSGFFAGNRRRLRELFTGTAPIVITANGLLQRGADSSYAFSQDANFWYLTGLDEPDLLLVLDRDEEYLIIPKRSAYMQTFDGAVDTSHLKKRSGIKTIYQVDEGWQILTKRIQRVKHVATLAVPPLYVDHYGMYTNPARAALNEKLRTIKSSIKLINVHRQLIELRMIKQPEELAAIQAAIDITCAGLEEALKPTNLKYYKYEYELEAELSRAYRRQAAGHAFEPIVAGGERACTLHNVANNGRLRKSELLLIDTGAEVEHYAADITRTISLGRPTKRQQEVYAAVQAVQKFALGLLQPGVLLKDYEHQVAQFMGQQLIELGLIKTNNIKNVRRYYLHATSHFLGLNVHDVGDYDKPLEPGMVLTVEPGIYIPKENIGIRLEDDVLITAKGPQLLTDKLARSLIQ